MKQAISIAIRMARAASNCVDGKTLTSTVCWAPARNKSLVFLDLRRADGELGLNAATAMRLGTDASVARHASSPGRAILPLPADYHVAERTNDLSNGLI